MPATLADLLKLGQSALERKAMEEQLGIPSQPQPAPRDYRPVEGSTRRTLGDLLMMGIEAGKGFAGVPSSQSDYPKAGTLGELISAALPMFGGLKALNAARTAEEAAPALAQGIKAYHGSPHDFDQFSLSKIGTGEGAQAYGHGLYFAEKEGIAKSYQEQLSHGDALTVRLPGQAKPLQGEAIDDIGLDAIKFLESGEKRAGEFPHNKVYYATKMADSAAEGLPGAAARNEAVKARIKEWGNAKIGYEPIKGRMYEVSINAHPDDFLDWDAPLSQQSEKVQKVANERWRMANDVRPDAPGSVVHRKLGAIGPNSLTARMPPGEQTAEGVLKAQGIPGIKYLDQGSRSAGQGTRNYVVFDDKLISIVKKYGIAGAVGAGLINQAQAQQLKDQGY